jgi:hypothetical protein
MTYDVEIPDLNLAQGYISGGGKLVVFVIWSKEYLQSSTFLTIISILFYSTKIERVMCFTQIYEIQLHHSNSSTTGYRHFHTHLDYAYY